MPFPRLHILGARIDAVTLHSALQFIAGQIQQKKFSQIITVNPLMLEETIKNPLLGKIFTEAGLVVPESIGITFLIRWKGLSVPERVPGIDLMLELCRQASHKGWSIYLVGAKPGVAEEAGKKLFSQFPGLKILGTHHGYFSSGQETKLLEDIQSKKPNLLFVGLAIPRQEEWIYQNKGKLTGIVSMGVGGSLDVISGRLKRAPLWMQKAGLEWLFRTFQEPFRFKHITQIPLILFRAAISRSAVTS